MVCAASNSKPVKSMFKCFIIKIVLLREIALEGKGSSDKKMSSFKEGYSNEANDMPQYLDENKISNEKCLKQKRRSIDRLSCCGHPIYWVGRGMQKSLPNELGGYNPI